MNPRKRRLLKIVARNKKLAAAPVRQPTVAPSPVVRPAPVAVSAPAVVPAAPVAPANIVEE